MRSCGECRSKTRKRKKLNTRGEGGAHTDTFGHKWEKKIHTRGNEGEEKFGSQNQKDREESRKL